MSNGSYVRRAGTTEVVLVPMLEASEDHVERLLAEVERLRMALARYGRHDDTCALLGPLRGGKAMPCNCGYAAARATPGDPTGDPP